MTDIGDVHHMLYPETIELQRPAQQILEDVGAHIAKMGKVVHGWAAGVESHLARFERHKFALLTRIGIVEKQFRHDAAHLKLVLPLIITAFRLSG